MPFSPTAATTAVPLSGSGPTNGQPLRGRRWPAEWRRSLLRTLGALAILGLFTPPVAAAASPAATAPGAEPVQAPNLLPATDAAEAGPSGPTQEAEETPPLLSEKAFAYLLRDGDLEQLDAACRESAEAGLGERLRQLQQRLLTLHPAPQPLEVVLANADVLLSCRAPNEAMDVLNRFGPAAGAERVQWLQLQWRAASAGLDHRRAALALERLRQESGTSLEAIALPLQRREDGTVISRSALELLALHLESRGFPRVGGELLVRARQGGLAGALRLQQAVALLAELPSPQREALMEAALDQAAAAGAWGLVAELLDTQAALPSERAVERRLRLSGRIDDAYGEWRWRREDPASAPRTRQLEIQLRSPRDPGGHAADLPVPATETAPTTTPAP
ncbi:MULTISPECIES: hypothetical protein [unclassified Cyanobium]|uniref:hypothetical protein n=1 Tax=unclassified Cyanobium TaxID=2627006 RepID=UPI0020CBF472|nr:MULTISPECIES: hypothetical protein [unclassified Cyanobium]MCP9833461.1 hypothetical protein [Cyanobium sp. La Preciosa 7G6]MCP9936226.1 hypothetical protein [Cyanobium sp. Aljojuca 7A6]